MVFNSQSAPILLVIGGIFVWLAGLSLVSWWLRSLLRQLSQVSFTDQVSEKIDHLEKTIDGLKTLVNDNQRATDWLRNESLGYFQKTGLVRFNPFDNTGGDQSFAVAILDGNNDGFVLSSLHGRSESRIYAKIIRKGKPEKHELSEEENEAVRKALSQRSG